MFHSLRVGGAGEPTCMRLCQVHQGSPRTLHLGGLLDGQLAASKSSSRTLWRCKRFGRAFDFERNVNDVTRRKLQVFVAGEPV